MYIGLYRWQFILEFPMAHQSDKNHIFVDDFSSFRMNLWKRPFRLCSSFTGDARNSIKQNTGLTRLNRPKSQRMHDLWNDKEKTSMGPNRNDTEKIGSIMVSIERIGDRCPPTHHLHTQQKQTEFTLWWCSPQSLGYVLCVSVLFMCLLSPRLTAGPDYLSTLEA